MRIIATADWHSGYQMGSDPRKKEDLMKFLDWFERTCSKRGADLVIVAGDLFHQRGVIPTEVYNPVIKFFQRSDHRYHLLVGNHDLDPDKSSVSNSEWTDQSVFGLQQLGNVDVFMEAESTTIHEVTFHYVGYEDCSDALEDQIRGMGMGEGQNVLTIHSGLSEGTMGPSGVSDDGAISVENDCFDPFDLVVAGHYHKPQSFGEKFYIPGSPLQYGYGERDQTKRVLEIDTKSMDVRSIETNSPKYVALESEDEIDSLLDYDCPVYLRFDRPVDSDLIQQLRHEVDHIRSVVRNYSTSETPDQRMDVQLRDEDDEQLIRDYLSYREDRVDALSSEHGIRLSEIEQAGIDLID